jgi:hypothetical protein
LRKPSPGSASAYRRARISILIGRINKYIEIKIRDVLVALPVSIEFMKTLQNILAGKGLNFFCHVYELAKQLTSSRLFDTKYDVSVQRFSLGKHLFWQGVRVEAKPKVHRELASTPVHKVNAKPNL